MINSISLKRLKNAEHLQFISNFLDIVSKNNPEKLKVKQQYDNLLVKKQEEETLFKKTKSNKITVEIIEIDKKRDKATMGIIKIVDGNALHHVEEIANAAKEIYDSVRVYGTNIIRQNYQMQTATINNIITDFETRPELKNAIKLLKLTPWKDELKRLNILFDQKYLERTAYYGEENPNTLREKRDEANEVYYELRNHINAHYTIDKTEDYTKLINNLNALIEQYVALLKNKKNKSSDDDTETSLDQTNSEDKSTDDLDPNII